MARTVVRIASNNYSLSSPAALKTIYAHGSPFTKSAFYDASRNPDAPRADLFSDRDPAAHASFRRRVAQLYSPSTVVRMEDEVRGCVRELLARLGEFAESGKRVDLQHWLQCYAFDVVGAVTVSRRFGFLDRGEDCLGLLEALHRSLVYLTHVGVVPEVHRWLYAVVKRVGRNGMSGLFAFAAGAVGERLREDEKGDVDEEGEDFLAKMVRMHRREPEKFGFLDMMMLRAELETAAAEGLIPSAEPVSYQQAQKLVYLQAVISEGLRVHSPPGVPLSREVPKGGAEVDGAYFPEGSVLGMNAWVMHLDKDVFGEDAEEYKPERWLVSKEDIGRMNRNTLTWGLGSRTCIGKNIALMEISILIPELVRKFDFQLVDPDSELETHNIFFVKQKNFWVKVKERTMQGQCQRMK
ncbi:hypothetical protein SLS57_012381 [Botryosphaeria dothidea]